MCIVAIMHPQSDGRTQGDAQGMFEDDEDLRIMDMLCVYATLAGIYYLL